MKSYQNHLRSIKSFGEKNEASLRKPIYRTSAIFPVLNNKVIKTKILFMGYWLVKRDIKNLGFLVSLRNVNGVLINRINTEINSPNAKEILIDELLRDCSLQTDDFVGSIELEVFSNINLVFPYPAFVVNYYNDSGSAVVHTTGRIYNDFEDLQENEEIRVKEAGFDLFPGANYSPFFSFVNGYLEAKDASFNIEIFTENGLVFHDSINVGDILPLQTVFVNFKDFIPLDTILAGKTGTVKIKHSLAGFFPRFVAGNFSLDSGAVSITHTFYDNAESDGHEHYHENTHTSELMDSAIGFPLFLDNGFYTELKLYPIYSPSDHTLSIELYDADGILLGKAEEYLNLSYGKSEFISIDFGSIIKKLGLSEDKVKSARLYKDWEKKDKIPTRLKYGLNIGKLNGEYNLPTNICFSSKISNANMLQKKSSFKWMPLVNNHNSIIVIDNSSFVKNYNSDARVTVDIYNTDSSEKLTRHYQIPANGQVRLVVDQELKEFLNGRSGWVTCRSENPFVGAWYFDFNQSGIMGGDHAF
jgi:hypothetical protein